MKLYQKYFFAFIFIFISTISFAQDGVINTNSSNLNKKEIEGKMMTIPYEPKMYMGNIGDKIYIESKWNFKQLSEYFRHQLDIQLKLKLQSILSPIVTFYIDSSKTSQDLEYIYKSTSLSFDLLDKPTAPTVENKKQSGIKNGQLAVEVNNDKKFTNIKITNPELVPYLNKKYKCDYFIFVNELDMNTVMESYDMANDTYQREVAVHYTIIDKTSKLITAGVANARFNSKENNPKKIVAQCFSAIANTIATKFSAIINPPTEKK